MKVLLLVHRRLIPPPAPQSRRKVISARWRTEYDVREALRRLGHEVEVLGLESNLQPLMNQIVKSRPEIVFNLLEEFDGEAIFDQNIVSYLELARLSYTGCNGRGLALARDKATAKKIVAYHDLKTPKFFVVSRRQKALQVPKGLRFPMIVKYLTEEASFGIGPDSVVHSAGDLKAQVQKLLSSFEADLLVEEFIQGRELYVGVLGNDLLEVLPPRELHFGRMPKKAPHIASAQVKWNASYRKRHGIYTRIAQGGDPTFFRRLRQAAQQIYRALRLTGYARLDFRVDSRGDIYFIEANPNPQICQEEDFADAAKAAGWGFDELIQRILDLGLSSDIQPPAHI
ncbi:MAG: D-alanine--D-alanine ligase [Bdellovibrionales bacterium]